MSLNESTQVERGNQGQLHGQEPQAGWKTTPSQIKGMTRQITHITHYILILPNHLWTPYRNQDLIVCWHLELRQIGCWHLGLRWIVRWLRQIVHWLRRIVRWLRRIVCWLRWIIHWLRRIVHWLGRIVRWLRWIIHTSVILPDPLKLQILHQCQHVVIVISRRTHNYVPPQPSSPHPCPPYKSNHHQSTHRVTYRNSCILVECSLNKPQIPL